MRTLFAYAHFRLIHKIMQVRKTYPSEFRLIIVKVSHGGLRLSTAFLRPPAGILRTSFDQIHGHSVMKDSHFGITEIAPPIHRHWAASKSRPPCLMCRTVLAATDKFPWSHAKTCPASFCLPSPRSSPRTQHLHYCAAKHRKRPARIRHPV